MAQDDQDEKKPPVMVGRVYSGEVAPPITTPEAVISLQAKRAQYAGKEGAVGIQVYFVARHIDNPILQASMLAYTDVRVASNDDFDEIFAIHHEVPATPTEDVAVAGTEDKKPAQEARTP